MSKFYRQLTLSLFLRLHRFWTLPDLTTVLNLITEQCFWTCTDNRLSTSLKILFLKTTQVKQLGKGSVSHVSLAHLNANFRDIVSFSLIPTLNPTCSFIHLTTSRCSGTCIINLFFVFLEKNCWKRNCLPCFTEITCNCSSKAYDTDKNCSCVITTFYLWFWMKLIRIGIAHFVDLIYFLYNLWYVIQLQK